MLCLALCALLCFALLCFAFCCFVSLCSQNYRETNPLTAVASEICTRCTLWRLSVGGKPEDLECQRRIATLFATFTARCGSVCIIVYAVYARHSRDESHWPAQAPQQAGLRTPLGAWGQLLASLRARRLREGMRAAQPAPAFGFSRERNTTGVGSGSCSDPARLGAPAFAHAMATLTVMHHDEAP